MNLTAFAETHPLSFELFDRTNTIETNELLFVPLKNKTNERQRTGIVWHKTFKYKRYQETTVSRNFLYSIQFEIIPDKLHPTNDRKNYLNFLKVQNIHDLKKSLYVGYEDRIPDNVCNPSSELINHQAALNINQLNNQNSDSNPLLFYKQLPSAYPTLCRFNFLVLKEDLSDFKHFLDNSSLKQIFKIGFNLPFKTKIERERLADSLPIFEELFKRNFIEKEYIDKIFSWSNYLKPIYGSIILSKDSPQFFEMYNGNSREEKWESFFNIYLKTTDLTIPGIIDLNSHQIRFTQSRPEILYEEQPYIFDFSITNR